MTPVKVPAKKRGRGRPRVVPEGEGQFIGCIASDEQHATFLALGGSKWLRDVLDREAKRLAKNKPPTG